MITNLSVFSQSISKVTSNKKNETFVTRKNRMLCTRHRKSLRLIGTLALGRVVLKVGAVGRRLALLAVDKVVRGNGLPYSLGSPRYFPKNDDYV